MQLSVPEDRSGVVWPGQLLVRNRRAGVDVTCSRKRGRLVHLEGPFRCVRVVSQLPVNTSKEGVPGYFWIKLLCGELGARLLQG